MTKPPHSAEVTQKYLDDLVEWVPTTRDDLHDRYWDFCDDTQLDEATLAAWLDHQPCFADSRERGLFLSGMLIGWEMAHQAKLGEEGDG